METIYKIGLITVAILAVSLVGMNVLGGETSSTEKLSKGEIPAIDENQPTETKTATLALGCFWGPEAKFGAVPGVITTQVGYSGGNKEVPTYHNLGDHTETVQIEYDPDVVTFRKLLEIFWDSHNPTVHSRRQYMSIIFTHNERQERIAEETKREEGGEDLVTEIRPFKEFHPAEDYHQKYTLRQHDEIFQVYKQIYSDTEQLVNSTAVARANGYVTGYGKIDSPDVLEGMGLTLEGKKKLFEIWKNTSGSSCSINWDSNPSKLKNGDYSKPSDDELKDKLTPLQYHVTQESGTEEPFNNKYWDFKGEGIYVDVVSNEPLFSSTNKFQSGSGWPSFTKPLEPSNIVKKEDGSLGMSRTEVRSKHGDSHLGHVFDDGPQPTGKRYCINSAALRFIPKENLKEEGYGEYICMFEGDNEV